MANSFPGFAGSRAVGLVPGSGLSLTPGAQAALMQGARAAALVGRGSIYFGGALLAAYVIHKLIQTYRAGGIDLSGYTVSCTRTVTVAHSAVGYAGFPGTVLCIGLTSVTPGSGLSPPPNAIMDIHKFDPSVPIIGGSNFPFRGFTKTGNPTQVVVPARHQWPVAELPIYYPGAWSGVDRPAWGPAVPYPGEMSPGYIRGNTADAGALAPPNVNTRVPGWAGVYPEALAPPRALPVPVPIPGVPGVVVPVIPGVGTRVESRVGERLVTTPVVNASSPTRPPPTLAEMKVRVSAALAGFKMFYSSVTEAADFVDALHKALPKCRQATTAKAVAQVKAARKYGWNKKYRKSEATPAAKLRAVNQFLADMLHNPGMLASEACQGHGRTRTAEKWQYGSKNGLRGAREQFVDQALKNLITESFKDYVYGRVGRKIGEISRDTGLPVGLQTIKSASQFNL